MEKIRSGQSFLFRKDGYFSTIIDVRMKDNVRGDLLNNALREALRRYLYLTVKLVEKDGNYYYEEDVISLIAVKTDKQRILGSMSTGYHLIDVTFIKNKICVAFHHALCDGRGIKPFIETLIYYYCKTKYNQKLDSTGIRLANDPLLSGETDEPIGTEPYAFDKNNIPQMIKDGYVLPEHSENTENCYRSEIVVNQSQFVNYAKAHHATPSILLALLVSGSIKKIHPNADKPIVCSMAMDYRHEIDMDNTYKNCVGSIYFPYADDVEKMTLPEQAALYRTMMKEQKNPDVVKAAVNNQIGLYNKLDTFKTLKEKVQMMSFLDGIRIDTYVISYLGQFNLDSCRDYIESMHLYSSGTGLRINMISVGNSIIIDVLQSFESDNFINALLSKFDETGVEYSATERILFETAKERAFTTATKQAERFFKRA